MCVSIYTYIYIERERESDNNVAHQQALHFYKMQPQGKVSLLVVTPTRTCSVRIAARLGRIRLCSTDSPWSAAHGQGSPTLLQTWNPARAHVESTPSTAHHRLATVPLACNCDSTSHMTDVASLHAIHSVIELFPLVIQ